MIELIHTIDDLHAARRTIEECAAEQYEIVADSFASANNDETAAIFEELAAWERRNRASEPDGPLLQSFTWYPVDPGDPEALHYLMHPYHAVKVALANEKRAFAFFQEIATADYPEDMRALARDLAAREREHIAYLTGWLQRLPKPEQGWDEDLDPPRFDSE